MRLEGGLYSSGSTLRKSCSCACELGEQTARTFAQEQRRAREGAPRVPFAQVIAQILRQAIAENRDELFASALERRFRRAVAFDDIALPRVNRACAVQHSRAIT